MRRLRVGWVIGNDANVTNACRPQRAAPGTTLQEIICATELGLKKHEDGMETRSLNSPDGVVSFGWFAVEGGRGEAWCWCRTMRDVSRCSR